MNGWIGIDLGGTKTEVAVLDDAGRVRWRHREPTPAHDYTAIVHLIETLVRQAARQCSLPWPQRVGVAIPGCLDPHTQLVRGANTQVLNGQPLGRDLSSRLGLDVRFENDANCLALSESVDGAGADADLVFAVIVGTGCGGGLALNGHVRTGRHALAGEWGHNPLPWPSADELTTPPCWCGLHGCLETWVSGPGWSREFQRRTGRTLTPPEIVQAMHEGDTAAQQSVRDWVDRLGRGLAQVVNLIDPDVVVLGGGLSLIPSLPQWLEAAIPRHTFYRGAHTPVRVAQHGDSSGVRGAAWLAR